jgi:hypothetical protein
MLGHRGREKRGLSRFIGTCGLSVRPFDPLVVPEHENSNDNAAERLGRLESTHLIMEQGWIPTVAFRLGVIILLPTTFDLLGGYRGLGWFLFIGSILEIIVPSLSFNCL